MCFLTHTLSLFPFSRLLLPNARCSVLSDDCRATQTTEHNRCPVDNSIFPSFLETGNALESSYEAFRFTESYGVIFQCNVKYCIGRCEPVCVCACLLCVYVCIQTACLWCPSLPFPFSPSSPTSHHPRRPSSSVLHRLLPFPPFPPRRLVLTPLPCHFFFALTIHRISCAA